MSTKQLSKKLIAIIFGFILCLCPVLPACGEKTDGEDKTGDVSQNYDQNDDSEQYEDNNDQEEITEMYLTINDNKLKVTLEQNASVDALIEILKQEDIVYTAHDYGGFEKVGNIGHTLPANDTYITTEPGDVILYQGNQICLFVGSNSWDYTRIGKINGYTADELRSLLGAGQGSVQVTISLR